MPVQSTKSFIKKGPISLDPTRVIRSHSSQNEEFLSGYRIKTEPNKPLPEITKYGFQEFKGPRQRIESKRTFKVDDNLIKQLKKLYTKRKIVQPSLKTPFVQDKMEDYTDQKFQNRNGFDLDIKLTEQMRKYELNQQLKKFLLPQLGRSSKNLDQVIKSNRASTIQDTYQIGRTLSPITVESNAASRSPRQKNLINQKRLINISGYSYNSGDQTNSGGSPVASSSRTLNFKNMKKSIFNRSKEGRSFSPIILMKSIPFDQVVE